MSLPSTAVFYDKNGDHMENVGINVGWFMSADGLARAMDEIKCPEGWAKVVLYGEYFTRKEMDEFMMAYFKWQKMENWIHEKYKKKEE